MDRPALRERLGEWLGLDFALTILVSAFLLFQVQPLISKFILPWFGGSPAVWTTCMLFFQLVLFCGYAYAHLTNRLLRPAQQAALHAVLLVLALLLLPITPNPAFKPLDVERPTLRILMLLGASVGLPYFVLSSTGPLVQAWFGRAYPDRSPYRLYALSNLGSLVALLSYPVVVEPAFDALVQSRIWSWSFAFFALLSCVGVFWLFRYAKDQASKTSAAPANRLEAPRASTRALWFALPALASLVLLATTNRVCEDVAVIPFLWIIPLSLYLLSFIIAFDHERWYKPRLYGALVALLSLVLVCSRSLKELLASGHMQLGFIPELFLHFSTLFCICMLCHGEVVRARPSSRYLTEFYLLISAGGAFGGLLVSLIAPRVFASFHEWTIGLTLAFAIGIVVAFQGGFRGPFESRTSLRLSSALFAGVTCILLGQSGSVAPLDIARNFYGVVSVYEFDQGDPTKHRFTLLHGRIMHGRQFAAPEKRALPVSYFSPQGGIGRALSYFQPISNARFGVLGLGVGTVATFTRPGQYLRFYEINPEVQRQAEKYFSYLRDCPAKLDVVLGDGRLSLEREPPQNYHLLALDAFSGDAVPMHLLTREAFAVYLRHLRPDGVLAVNITNQHIDLAPVIYALAAEYELQAVRVISPPDDLRLLYRADWMLLSKNQAFLSAMPKTSERDPNPRRILWTDHYSNLFKILK